MPDAKTRRARPKRYIIMKKFSEKWQALEKEVTRRGGKGDEVVCAMQDHYKLYGESVYLWLAGLYDKNIGGFYYSNSGRDNEPFLPDIESTNQATNLLLATGLLDEPDDLPLAMREQMARFCQSLISAEDGYIYHPQWDYNDPNWYQKDSRLGRDLTWAIDMGRKFKFKYPYPTANERFLAVQNKSAEEKGELPEHLRSADALVSYLETFDWETNAYFSGNNVSAQASQIISAGLGDTMIDFLNKKQNPKTGLWGVQGGYDAINALLKISGAYCTAGAIFPNADKAMKAAIDCITLPVSCGTICWQYNAWYSVNNLVSILRSLNTAEANAAADEAVSVLLADAPRAIRATTEKVGTFAKPDGAFSYLQKSSTGFSQKAPVSIHMTVESDVNASVIASSGTTRNMYSAMELLDFYVPIYDKEDREKFLEALDY